MKDLILITICSFAICCGVAISLEGLDCRERIRFSIRRRFTRLYPHIPASHRRLFLVSIVAGIALAWWTKALIAVVIAPLVALVIPILLAPLDSCEIDTLESLDRWISSLISSVSTGKSLVDAIRSTRSHLPDLLSDPVRLLVSRLDQRWTLRSAFYAFSDELDSADADTVIASLILIAERGGSGATITLKALSSQIRHRLTALREIAAEQEKPRIVVRQVTGITAAVLGAAFIFSPHYFHPYTTPLGQMIAAVLISAYLGSLWVLKVKSRPRRRDRILVCHSYEEACS